MNVLGSGMTVTGAKLATRATFESMILASVAANARESVYTTNSASGPRQQSSRTNWRIQERETDGAAVKAAVDERRW